MASLHRRLRLLLVGVFVSGVLLLHVDAAGAASDAGALLAAKAALSDPAGALSRWRARSSGWFCRWPHVSCAWNSTYAAAVAGLDLGGLSLGGGFPVALCTLRSLRDLNLSSNEFVGPLPACLTSLPALARLDLSSNSFSGEVPVAYGGGFPLLAVLNLAQNFICGAFPGFLANITALQELLLAYNSFSPSPLPDNLGDLSALRVLFLASCSLNGSIPASIGKLKNLVNLDLSTNKLSGEIPTGIGNLSSLVQLELYANQLSGRIPAGLGGLEKLRFLDMSSNRLSGEIPEDMFTAPSLESVHLFVNNLTGRLPATLVTAPNLVELMIFANQIEGPFPPEFGKNCPLVVLDSSDNRMSGPIPATLCASGKLEQLMLLDNKFEDAIPAELGKCRSLARVRLQNNRLSGPVPPEFWALPGVYLLELGGNALSGNVDAAIGGAANLSRLVLSENRFTGILPTELGNLTNMKFFLASNNSFSGTMPPSLTNLSEILRLDLSNNSLSGEIPRNMGQLKKLELLDLSNNHLNGSIPAELLGLTGLGALDLSYNELSGELHVLRQNTALNDLNLSYNKLTGTVPFFFNIIQYQNSFLGNPGLCYGLCSSHGNSSSNRHARMLMFASIITVSAVVMLMSVFWFTYNYRSYKGRAAEVESENTCWVITAFHKVEFSERDIVDSLTEDNVIGEGGAGKVYKAVVSPKEYAYTLYVTQKSDVYSFGVVILELVTGTSPMAPKIAGKDLVEWACTNVEQSGPESVLDQKLAAQFQDEMCKVLNIALLCVKKFPNHRPSMRAVVKMLLEIKGEYKPKACKTIRLWLLPKEQNEQKLHYALPPVLYCLCCIMWIQKKLFFVSAFAARNHCFDAETVSLWTTELYLARARLAILFEDKLPDATLSYFDPADGELKTVTVGELTAGKKAVLFAVPSAFTPTCSQKHLPGFVEKAGELRAKGVDTIACVLVNDAFVMHAWKESLGLDDDVLLLSET
ncbi:hypothetical protein ABZP36_035388 [Zizania latifolia]